MPDADDAAAEHAYYYTDAELAENPLITYRDRVENVKHKLREVESTIASIRVLLAELQDDLNAESL